MAGEVKKLDFYKTKRTTPTTQPTQAKAVADTPAVAEPVKKAPLMQKKEQAINTAMHIEGELSNMLTETADLFNKVGLKTPAAEIKQLLNELNRKRFSVAVVGEFSRGKSTFINNLFAREMLPVGNTPTTAMLTRIRYNEKPMLVVANGKGKKSKPMPLVEESWDGLVADLYGNDPFGVAFVGVNSDWLKGGLEIIDTPGAGDLEAKRALIIGDALRGSDGAIIAVSADTPMSLSEQVFVKERLISMKTPFLMLVITKLDRIPENERDRIVDFIKTKLDMWKSEWKTEMVSANGEGAEDWDIDIPIYVPGEVSMPTDKYKDIINIGMKVKVPFGNKIINGFVMNITMCIRNLIFSKYENVPKKYITIVVIVMTLLSLLSYDGPISLLPCIGSIMYTISLAKSNLKITRIMNVITCALYIIYDIKVLAIAGIISASIELLSTAFAIYRYDVKKR